MKCAKSVFVVLGFALLSPAPFPHLIPAAHAQNQLWITQFSSIERDSSVALASDGAGGSFSAGWTEGSLAGRPLLIMQRARDRAAGPGAGRGVWRARRCQHRPLKAEVGGTGWCHLPPRECLAVEGNPVTRARLEAAGARVMTYHGAEISHKGCGGPTCMTRPLERS